MCLKKFRALLSAIRRNTGKQSNEATAEAHKQIIDGVSEIEKLTHDIADSRTYLIYPKKAILLSKIETVKQEIAKGVGIVFLLLIFWVKWEGF